MGSFIAAFTDIYYNLATFILLGLSTGSFLGVVGMRLPIGQKIGEPKRSYCETCERNLKWYELVPVLSWLIQGGKCRGCKTRISIFYPIIEIYTMIAFVLIYLNVAGFWWILINFIVASAVVIIWVMNNEVKKIRSSIMNIFVATYLILLIL